MAEYVRQSVDPTRVYSNSVLVYNAEGLFDVYGEKEPIIYEDFVTMKARIERIYDEMNFRCRMVPLRGYEYLNVCDVTKDDNAIINIPSKKLKAMAEDNVPEDTKEKFKDQNINWDNVPGTTGFARQFFGDFSYALAINTDAFYVAGCPCDNETWPVSDPGLNQCGIIFYKGSRPVILLGASRQDANSFNFKAALFSTMNTPYDAYSQYIMMLNQNLEFYNNHGLHETGVRGKRYGIKAIALTQKNLETFLRTMYFGPVSSSYPETSQAYIDWYNNLYINK